MAFASPIEVDFCCNPGAGCLAQEIRLSFWFNSICGRMFETACDNGLHCIDGWPGVSLLSWKSRLHSDEKEMDLDLLSRTICSHWFWTQSQGRVLFMTSVYSQCWSFHAASFSCCWCNVKWLAFSFLFRNIYTQDSLGGWSWSLDRCKRNSDTSWLCLGYLRGQMEHITNLILTVPYRNCN